MNARKQFDLNFYLIGQGHRHVFYEDTMSKRKADAISNGIFLIGLAILAFTNAWWPGILIVLWLTLFCRQILTQRFYDLMLTTIFFVGLYVISLFELNWIIIPVLLVLGGIYIIFQEYCVAEGIEEDPIEEKEKEIEDGTVEEEENGKIDRKSS